MSYWEPGERQSDPPPPTPPKPPMSPHAKAMLVGTPITAALILAPGIAYDCGAGPGITHSLIGLAVISAIALCAGAIGWGLSS